MTNPAEILLFIESVVVLGGFFWINGGDLDAFDQKRPLGTHKLAPGGLSLVAAVSGGGLPCRVQDRAA